MIYILEFHEDDIGVLLHYVAIFNKTYLSRFILFIVKSMCGILAYIRCKSNEDEFRKSLKEIESRGPDATDTKLFEEDDIILGFNRLSINDLSLDGMQPMTLDNKIWLICNGEIFNHKELEEKYTLDTQSQSDCEVILHLYKILPFNQLVSELDGEFAFLIYDSITKSIWVTRDRYGVRPLFIGEQKHHGGYGFSSELKSLKSFVNVHQFTPGNYMKMNLNFMNFDEYKYHSPYEIEIKERNSTNDMDTILSNINITFKRAVKKRLMSDRPICCLLSGGLDSSLVASIVASQYPAYTLNTFSIGFKGSPDLHYAKKVADHIKSVHHSIELDEADFLKHIEDTIYTIESYDTTSVRASVGNLLVSKYIKENTDCKVVFNGDYSDEVCGGYKYFKRAPSCEAFDDECRRLVQDICYFDSLRSDRTISSQGLEARVPFADKDFVALYLSIPANMRISSEEKIEKYLLRKAFENDNLLPYDILWRPKEAFSDGVSKADKSWHKILENHIDTLVSDDEYKNNVHDIQWNTPHLKESFYYRTIFEQKYDSNHANVIPYFWLPKWCGKNVVDPSARELS